MNSGEIVFVTLANQNAFVVPLFENGLFVFLVIFLMSEALFDCLEANVFADLVEIFASSDVDFCLVDSLLVFSFGVMF